MAKKEEKTQLVILMENHGKKWMELTELECDLFRQENRLELAQKKGFPQDSIKTRVMDLKNKATELKLNLERLKTQIRDLNNGVEPGSKVGVLLKASVKTFQQLKLEL